MIYFVPAWYQENNWCENEQTWYVRRMHTEFDDTVKHIQLFHRSGDYPCQILLLSYAPNFRHFLHRQGIFRVSYWSCFDAIQAIRRKKAAVLSFHDLNWPADIEFIYTPFVVTAWRRKKKYAQIEFGEDGNPIHIDVYKNDKIYRRIIYDDRGFISGLIVYKDEKPFYQDYLSEKGIWKIRYYQSDGHVEVNPEFPVYLLREKDWEQSRIFSRLSYDSLEQIIEEVLKSYLEWTGENSIFCVAMHECHAALLKKILKDRKVILSFFGDRYRVRNHPEVQDMVEKADFIIADSKENQEKIQQGVKTSLEKIIAITPYDTRKNLGISQQLNVQKILVPVDDMEENTFGKLIWLLGDYLSVNEKAQITLLTRRAESGRKKGLMEQVYYYLKEAGIENCGGRFSVEEGIDELAVSNCMRGQRIIADLRDIPELYLQIMAISIGIPQIVCTKTEFVENRRNGIVLEQLNKLHEALDFYLNGLSNWNEAMVCSLKMGEKYTTNKLMDAWRGVIEFVK